LTTEKNKTNDNVTQVENRSSVLSRRLKAISDGGVMTSDGRAFQTRAAETAKTRSPTVMRRVGGTGSSRVEAELSRRRQSARLPHGIVRVQRMAEARRIAVGSGKRAQRV